MNTIHLIQSNWEFLLSLLPNGWEKLARETKAVERLRGIPNIPVLMRLLFIHLGLGHSLRETVSEAELAGIAKISDVALLNRLRNCELFFHGLVMSLLSENGVQTNQELMNGLVVRVVDATNVKEHGKTGSIWRLHTVLRLPDLICDHFELTPNKGAGTGETLARIPIKKRRVFNG